MAAISFQLSFALGIFRLATLSCSIKGMGTDGRFRSAFQVHTLNGIVYPLLRFAGLDRRILCWE